MTIKWSNLYSQIDHLPPIGSVILYKSDRSDAGHLQGPGTADPSWLLWLSLQSSLTGAPGTEGASYNRRIPMCPHYAHCHSGTLPKEMNEKFPEFSNIYYTFALKHTWSYGATDNITHNHQRQKKESSRLHQFHAKLSLGK